MLWLLGVSLPHSLHSVPPPHHTVGTLPIPASPSPWPVRCLPSLPASELSRFPFPPEMSGNVCTRPFLSRWPCSPMMKAMQCIAILHSPERTPVNTHVHCLSLLPHHMHRLRHIPTNTPHPQTHTHRSTDTSEEMKLEELLPGETRGPKPGL